MNRFLLIPVLLLLAMVARAQDSEETLAVVDNKLIPWSAFTKAYTESHPEGTLSANQLEAFLPSFIRTHVLLAEAESLRLDTLSTYHQAWASLEHPSSLAKGGNGIPTGNMLGKEGNLYVEHFYLPLHQHATWSEEQALRQVVNAVYEQVSKGQTLAQAAANCPNAQVVCHWLAPYEMLFDVEAAAMRLSEGEVSSPVLSTDGFHLIRRLKPETPETVRLSATSAQSAPSVTSRSNSALQTAYREGLLLQLLYAQVKDKALNDAAGCHHYFAQNQKRYAWTVPHFKGTVFHCKDKKTQKAVKKLLAKRPQYTWSQLMADSTYSHIFSKVECTPPRLYALGEDSFVDYLVFGGPKPQIHAEFPVNIVLGNKQKTLPDSYLDVKEQVVLDYQQHLEQEWYEQLCKKHGLVVNEKLCKKLFR